MNTDNRIKSIFSFLFFIFKILFVLPLAVGFAGATVYMLFSLGAVLAAFAKHRVFPLSYISAQICMILAAAMLALVCARIIFSKKLSKVSFGKTLLLFAVFIFASAVFTLIDNAETRDFDIYYYPPYITEWKTQSAYEELECDYSQDVIYLQGSFTVPRDGFRNQQRIELITAADMTDRYRVEIIYKGKEAEMYMFHSDYEMETYGEYTDSINIWPKDYDYELSAEDRAYMYKNRVFLEYSEPLVVEKILVYTAYPEKFDISQMWLQN